MANSVLFTGSEEANQRIFPPMAQMMTGAVLAFFEHPRYRIAYTDGTWEEAVVESMTDEDRDSPFRIVGNVQALRPHTHRG